MNKSLVQSIPATSRSDVQKYTPSRKRFQDRATLHLPLLFLNGEGTVLHLTSPARRLLEYRPDQRFDPCLFSHVHSKNLYQVMRDVAAMVRHGKTQASWLLRIRTGRGRWRWYKATVQNHLDADEAAITILLRDLNDW